MMKQLPHITLTIFIGVLSLVGLLMHPIETQAVPRTIVVRSEVTVYAMPDTAILSIQIQSRHLPEKQSFDFNPELLKSLQAFGIAEEDITTSSASISNQNDMGVNISNSMRVVVRDFSRLYEILTILPNEYAVSVQINSFSLNDWQSLSEQGRQDGLANAREIGRQMADEAGYELGEVIRIDSMSEAIATPAQRDLSLVPDSMPISGMGKIVFWAAPVGLNSRMTVTFELKPKSEAG